MGKKASLGEVDDPCFVNGGSFFLHSKKCLGKVLSLVGKGQKEGELLPGFHGTHTTSVQPLPFFFELSSHNFRSLSKQLDVLYLTHVSSPHAHKVVSQGGNKQREEKKKGTPKKTLKWHKRVCINKSC